MSTLKTHIRNIIQKMQVKNIAELVELVLRENLLPYLQMYSGQGTAASEEGTPPSPKQDIEPDE